jgi:hypothetical protein
VILIWGFRVRFRHTGTTAFFCPRCGGDRQARLGVLRRWFTLFWIPIIPLKVLGEVVQCETCNTRFQPQVLERATTAVLTDVLGNAVRVLSALIVGAGDQANPDVRQAAVRDIAARVPGYDDSTLSSDLLALDPHAAEQYVHPLADGLEVAGKERFVADLTRIALAGGTIAPDQRSLLDVVGRGLGLTPAHVTGIVTSVVAARSPEATTEGGPTGEPGVPPLGPPA